MSRRPSYPAVMWVMTHRSDRMSFKVTHGETPHLNVPEPADVHTSSLTSDTPANDEPRRITLTLPTDCWQEAWLSADEAERLGMRLVELAAVLRQDSQR